jgi:hypothetical protein
LQQSARGTWGWSPTEICGSTFSRRSTLPRRWARGECGVRCTPVATPFKSGRVEASFTSRRSSSRRTADDTMGGSICTTTMTTCRSSSAGS